MIARMFESQQSRLLQGIDAAHESYYRAAVFGGPSLYFHLRALDAGKERDFGRFSEYVYALLAAWGMHRMGPGGSKMREFGEFEVSLRPLWPLVLELQRTSPDDLGQGGRQGLGRIFTGIRCMASGTSLVGNSKVMAHALPNLVAPVDREYTLKFLFGHGQIRNGIDEEWQKLQTILSGFFYPVLRAEAFKSRAAEWMGRTNVFKWDTSPLKIVDNLVIGLSKHSRAEEGLGRDARKEGGG